MESVLTIHPDLGRIFVPEEFKRSISLPGMPVRKASTPEMGIFIATQKRWNETKQIMETLWASITHNERVDMGAAIQVNRTFGTVGTTSVGVITAMAIANASLTKAKTDLSLGAASANVTTNEATTAGLSRTAATVQNYVTPASLGATFSCDFYKSFSVSGTITAYGAGLFDSTTVSGSHLYVEDNFSTSASLINGDTLNVTITVTN